MLVIAHRGASVAAPENTVEAFRLADELGADGVELDVRLAPDGRLVVAHDPLPDDPSVVHALPGLATILAACGDRMLVNVEIKNEPVEGATPGPPRSGADPSQDATWSGSVPESGTKTPQMASPTTNLAVVAPTIEALHASGIELARFLISSFSWRTIDACRQLDPAIATAALCSGFVEAEQLDRIARRGHLALHPYERRLTAEHVARCHDRGLLVTTWTCNDPDRIRELAAIGVDGVCTDVPDIALDALGRSGPANRPRWARATSG